MTYSTLDRSIKHFFLLGLCLFLLSACATKPLTPLMSTSTTKHTTQTGIGPYADFTGRLLVIQKAKRWQVMLHWKAEKPTVGWLRLYHAASSRIIEVTWKDHMLRTRDNHDRPPLWKTTAYQYFQQQGINISPEDLAVFLLGGLPEGFSKSGRDEWRGHRGKSLLHVVWNSNRKSLSIMDMHQGSKIVLLIL